MLNRIRRTIREKGQGLTEYVLILAFIAGIAFMMFGGNGSLKGTVVGTLTETVRILGGLFDEKTDWGNPANRDSFSDSNQEERYQHDQKMLENLANFFMDMKKEDVDKLLEGVGNTNSTANSDNIWLGNIVRDNKGDVHFLTRQVKVDQNDSDPLTGKMTINDGSYLYNYNDRVLNWMQGDYGNNGSYNLDYSSSYNYLVSDYAMGQFERTNYNWNKLSFHNDTGANGVKLKLGYTKDNNGNVVVDKVRITVDQLSRNPQNNSSSAYSSGYSNGLEVTVKKGQDPQYTNVGVRSDAPF
jgi:hypothetical protein